MNLILRALCVLRGKINGCVSGVLIHHEEHEGHEEKDRDKRKLI
jgi:hypothetical protein